MRLAGSIILALAAFAVSVPACAQTYDPRWPICMKRYAAGMEGGGERIDCIFTSMPQCRAAASGLPATCEINPYGSLSDGPWRLAPRARGKATNRS